MRWSFETLLRSEVAQVGGLGDLARGTGLNLGRHAAADTRSRAGLGSAMTDLDVRVIDCLASLTAVRQGRQESVDGD